jgi:hypothetical protein
MKRVLILLARGGGRIGVEWKNGCDTPHEDR